MSNYVETGVQIDGHVHALEPLYFGGHLKGKLTAESGVEIILLESSHVEGTIDADHVTIAGTFVGEVFAKKSLKLEVTAQLRGTVHTPSFSMVAVSIFEGEIVRS